MPTVADIEPCGWLLLAAFVVIAVKVECAYQAMRLRDWRDWLPDALILFGCAWQAWRALDGQSIDFSVALVACGIAGLMLRGRPINKEAP